MIRLGFAQYEPRIGEVRENLKKLDAMLRLAEQKSLDVLVLPELANSGYKFESAMEAASLSEIVPRGEMCRKLMKFSEQTRLVVSGICEQDNGTLYNSAVIFANGDHLGTYRKAHLFNEEKLWFQQGNNEPPVVEFKGYRFGIMICWDWIFPEMARILALKGAYAILHPSNLVLQYCQNAMRTRCLENGVFAVTANRIGEERGLKFSGQSQVTSPNGQVLVSAPDDFEGVMYADVNLDEAENKLLTPRNDRLKDRRPELYGLLTLGS